MAKCSLLNELVKRRNELIDVSAEASRAHLMGVLGGAGADGLGQV